MGFLLIFLFYMFYFFLGKILFGLKQIISDPVHVSLILNLF